MRCSKRCSTARTWWSCRGGCAALHPADVANLLESQPTDDRRLVWGELPARLAAQALVEVSPGVRESLIEHTSRERLVDVLRELDADDLRYLSEWLPEDVMDDVAAMLDAADRSWLEQNRAYPERAAGRLMTQDVLTLSESQTVKEAVDDVRRKGRLPAHTDRLFVVDSRKLLIGAIGLGDLLIADDGMPVASLMDSDIRRFRPDDSAEEVATAFDRYDLLSAPIVDDRGKLIGRVTADAVMDFVRASSETEVLALAGLRQAEDLFAPVADSARNRWPWLAVNLATAFLASRIIGAFESTIQQIVALAALMPIVASIGGNTGNQTMALVVRGLALDQLKAGSGRYLLRKELTVGLLNGVLWGTFVGLRDDCLSIGPAWPRHERRCAAESRRRRCGGGARAAWPLTFGAGPCPGIERGADVRDRRHGVLPVPRSRAGVPHLAAGLRPAGLLSPL